MYSVSTLDIEGSYLQNKTLYTTMTIILTTLKCIISALSVIVYGEKQQSYNNLPHFYQYGIVKLMTYYPM